MAKDPKIPRLTRAQIAEGLDHVPLDTILLGSTTGGRLTAKQKEFARNLALGKSKAQAYRDSYNTKGTSKTQAQDGWKLSRKPEVSQITEAYAAAIEAAKQRTPAQLREFVIHQLTLHALNAEKEAQRIQALKLLGTVTEVAAFTERRETTTVRKAEDVRAALLEKLRTITGQAVEGEVIQKEDAAESLLAEINAGVAALAEENHQPADENTDLDSADPTTAPPPAMPVDHLSSDLHSIPHSQSPINSVPHKGCANNSIHDIEDGEVIGVDEYVSSYTVEATPIVAEKEPAGDPTPLDIETPPVDGT
jgi:predicted RNA-binding Zn ribbon-like protein